MDTERQKRNSQAWFERHKHPCVDCGKTISPDATRCQSCETKRRWKEHKIQPWSHSGRQNPNWKSGRYKDSNGYIMVFIAPSDFFYPMAGKAGYVLEHRLVMAKHLNRCLVPWEVVHHKNGIRDDNRIENLELLPDKRFHLIDSNTKRELERLKIKIEEQAKAVNLLKERVTLLEAENTILRESLVANSYE